MMILYFAGVDLQYFKLNYLDCSGQPLLLTRLFRFFWSQGIATPCLPSPVAEELVPLFHTQSPPPKCLWSVVCQGQLTCTFKIQDILETPAFCSSLDAEPWAAGAVLPPPTSSRFAWHMWHLWHLCTAHQLWTSPGLVTREVQRKTAPGSQGCCWLPLILWLLWMKRGKGNGNGTGAKCHTLQGQLRGAWGWNRAPALHSSFSFACLKNSICGRGNRMGWARR